MEFLLQLEFTNSSKDIKELQNGDYAIANGNSLMIINKKTFKIKEKLENHEKEINRVLETKSGKLITISADQTIVIYELDENNHYIFIQRINETGKINSIIELSTEQILTCNCDHNIRLYKYNKENNIYELDYSYDVKELVTHAIEANNGKVLILTFDGDNKLLKLYSYNLNKKKIEKMILAKNSIVWNNYESMINLSDKFVAINLFNTIAIIDKDNVSVFQIMEFIKDFIITIGLYKNPNSIIYFTLSNKKFIWERNEEGVWEAKDENINLNEERINCLMKTTDNKLLVGSEKGLKIFQFN